MSKVDNFLSIQNFLKTLNPISVVQKAVEKSYDLFEAKKGFDTTYVPWNMFLLVKWALVFGDKKSKVMVTDQGFQKLMLMMNSLADETNRFLVSSNQYDKYKFFRQLAFQQFWLQEEVSASTIGRQIELFLNSRFSKEFDRMFKKETGLTLREYFEISMMCWTFFVTKKQKKNNFLNLSWFGKLNTKYSFNQIGRYLDLFSLDHNAVKMFGELDVVSKNLDDQIIERTPLIRYPMIQLPGGYEVYSPRLFSHTIESLVYDLLKARHGVKFCDLFGKSLETYIQKLLNYLNVPNLNGRQLSKILKQSKIVDFILPHRSGTILVEVKATELKTSAQMNPETGRMINALETSVLSGIRQAMVMLEQLISNPSLCAEVDTNKPVFLLIVTYRNLYLGLGKDAWEEFIEDGLIKKLKYSNAKNKVIQPENIFFLSIDEFELLLKVANGKTERMVKILKQAVLDNKHPHTAKFGFGLHLSQYINKSTRKKTFPFLEGHLSILLYKIATEIGHR